VLIGMPYAGKSSLGEELSKIFDKKFIDIDKRLEEKGLELKDIKHLETFRKAEALESIAYSSGWNQVIACGGGIVLNPEAMAHLKSNGLIIFLDIKIQTLYSRIDGTRPLIKKKGDLKRIYEERLGLYQEYADLVIKEEELLEIVEKINEYFSN
ncbi:MAG: shikimate kinase, partial [Bacilli bacterium]|nr:shikimate kinase [Bacilli bacterium]